MVGVLPRLPILSTRSCSASCGSLGSPARDRLLYTPSIGSLIRSADRSVRIPSVRRPVRLVTTLTTSLRAPTESDTSPRCYHHLSGLVTEALLIPPSSTRVRNDVLRLDNRFRRLLPLPVESATMEHIASRTNLVFVSRFKLEISRIKSVRSPSKRGWHGVFDSIDSTSDYRDFHNFLV